MALKFFLLKNFNAVIHEDLLIKTILLQKQFYFRDRWLFFDAAVIIVSVILAFIDLFKSETSYSTISKIVRGVFRLLRVFLLFRKVFFLKILKSNSRNCFFI